MGHCTVFLQALQGQIKDQQQGPYSSGEVVDVETTGDAEKVSRLTGLAPPLLGCHVLKPMCHVINLMHFTMKSMHHLWNQIYHLFRHTPYTESESPPTELKTSHAVHITS